MALAVTANTVSKPVDLGPYMLYGFALTASGNYATGGDSLASVFTGIDFKSSVKPIFILAQGIAGYKYEFDYTNNKLLVRQDGGSSGSAAALPEIGATTYPVGVSGDTILCLGIFQKK